MEDDTPVLGRDLYLKTDGSSSPNVSDIEDIQEVEEVVLEITVVQVVHDLIYFDAQLPTLTVSEYLEPVRDDDVCSVCLEGKNSQEDQENN